MCTIEVLSLLAGEEEEVPAVYILCILFISPVEGIPSVRQPVLPVVPMPPLCLCVHLYISGIHAHLCFWLSMQKEGGSHIHC